jgi:hypothetical protein
VIQAMRAGLVFEPEIIALAETYIRKGSIVLDIGSNFGQMAVIFSRLVGPKGTVQLETRLRLVYPIGLTVVASVAIRPRPS